MEKYASEAISKKLAAYNTKQSPHKTNRTNQRPLRAEDTFNGALDKAQIPSASWALSGLHFLVLRHVQTGVSIVWLAAFIIMIGLHWRRMYTVRSFRDHIEECGDSGEMIDGEHVSAVE